MSLRELTPLRRLTLLTSEGLAEAVPELEANLLSQAQGLDLDLSTVRVGTSVYRHGFLGQAGECIHAAVVSANARRTTAGARKPSRSINHCWL